MTQQASGISVRRPRMTWRAQADWQVADGPELSAMVVAFSLLIPHLEPYLVRSMHQARRHVTSAQLAADLQLFCAQEGQHHALHTRFNQSLGMPDSARLAGLLARLSADYRRFTSTRSLRFNLAYAEGFEAFTTAMSLFWYAERWLQKLRPGVRELFEWHMVEELEHRTVAFDVYHHVSGGYLYRLAVSLFAQWHLNRFVFRAAGALLATLPAREIHGLGARLRRLRRTAPLYAAAVRRLLPRALAVLLPGYTPHAIELPASLLAVATRYTEQWSAESYSPKAE